MPHFSALQPPTAPQSLNQELYRHATAPQIVHLLKSQSKQLVLKSPTTNSTATLTTSF